MIPHELLAIGGLGVIGYLGSEVLKEMGQKVASVGWSVVVYVAAGIVSIKFFYEGTKAIGAIFNVSW